jgi:hypothetical protein
MVEVYVGLDVSDKSTHLCVVDGSESGDTRDLRSPVFQSHFRGSLPHSVTVSVPAETQCLRPAPYTPGSTASGLGRRSPSRKWGHARLAVPSFPVSLQGFTPA